jgi:uncharacterized membrane protein YfcA
LSEALALCAVMLALNGGYSVLGIIAGALFAAYAYRKHFAADRSLASLFFLLCMFAAVAALAMQPGLFAGAVTVFLGIELYLLLEVKSARSHARERLGIFHYLLAFAILAYAGSLGAPQAWFSISLLLMPALFLMLRDYLAYAQGTYNRRLRLFALLIALGTVQVLWAAMLLPIGFLGAASLALAFYIIAVDSAGHSLAGTLSPRRITENIAFFLASSGVILAAQLFSL